MTKQFLPSAQQQKFLDWCVTGTGSCILEAVAGSGKTTTLIEAVTRIAGQVALVAYNKKIASEIDERLKERMIDWKKAKAGTCHSFGFAAFRKAFANVQVDDKKVERIAEALITEGSDLRPDLSRIVNMVSLAKQRIVGVDSDINDNAAWSDIIIHHDIFDDVPVGHSLMNSRVAAARQILALSNEDVRNIDFDDMIYLPLLRNMRFWQYDVVMIDEAQDTNPARRLLVRRMLKPNGRLIAVGDCHQAIYGFTGADNDSLDQIRRAFNCIDLPMTNTYRCPKNVVAFAKQWVGHIDAVDTAPDGKVSTMTTADLFRDLSSNGGLSSAAILCRNTAPLVSLAMRFIRHRFPCKIEGRDVGAQLRKMATRWKVADVDQFEDKLNDWAGKETAKARAAKKESKVQQIDDTVATLHEIVEQCRAEGAPTMDAVVAYIDGLFSDNVRNMLVLSTIHKSKGREWEQVYWLDRATTCPSKYATQDWEKDQEVNIQYVAATRAKRELIDLIPQEERR